MSIYRKEKIMKIKIKSVNTKKIKIINGKLEQSDYFVCRDCGYGMYAKILGNTKKCPECGGTMFRQ